MTIVVARDRFTEFLDEMRPFGARADQTHLAARDVEKLRQLIDAQAAQKFPGPCRAWLTEVRPHGTRFRFGIDRHRAKFEHLKGPPAAPDANLPIDDGAGRV